MRFGIPATVAKEGRGTTSIEYGVIAPWCRSPRSGVDGDGRVAEYDVPVGVDWADDGGRWLNGINVVERD